MKFRPFRGVRPPRQIAEIVSARPYDVMSSEEARIEGADEKSLLHITKPEINFEDGTSEHDERVYGCALEQYRKFRQNGWLVEDSEPHYYIYAQTMGERTQYGLMVAANVDDYIEGRIKKHELTRRDKEEDRMRHVKTLRAHVGPAFFVYKHRDDMKALIDEVVRGEAEYDFIAKEDGFRHQLWVVDTAKNEAITAILSDIDVMYIADGHHRSAAAARVGAEMREGENYDAEAESNYFLAVCFPDDELKVLDYNRVVKDLNGKSEAEMLEALKEDFEVVAVEKADKAPTRLHEFSLYMGGRWYKLTAKAGRYDDADPIGVLDVDISSRLILDKQLGITDLRSDKRIDFVGGLRGLEELERRVDSGEMAMALALYPVTMKQIIDIADSGNIMPPKATWFEPKLRSGVVVHEF